MLIPYGIDGVLIGWIAGDLLLVALVFPTVLPALSVVGKARSFSAAEFGRYSLYTLFAALLGFVIGQADRLITLSQQGLSGLAIYNAASVGSGIAGYAPSALVTILLPSLAALSSAKGVKDMRDRIRISTRYVSLLAIPIAFALAGVMEVPLRIFGSDYLSGLLPAIMLSVATGLTSLSAVYAVALLAKRKLRWYTMGNVLGLSVLLLIAETLTPIIGLDGPALGRTGLMIVVTLVYAFASFSTGIFEIDIRAFVVCTTGSAIVMAIFLIIVSLVHGLLLQLALLPALGCIGLLIYTGTLRVFRLATVEDIGFISKLLPNRLVGIIPILAWLVGYDPTRSM